MSLLKANGQAVDLGKRGSKRELRRREQRGTVVQDELCKRKINFKKERIRTVCLVFQRI